MVCDVEGSEEGWVEGFEVGSVVGQLEWGFILGNEDGETEGMVEGSALGEIVGAELCGP